MSDIEVIYSIDTKKRYFVNICSFQTHSALKITCKDYDGKPADIIHANYWICSQVKHYRVYLSSITEEYIDISDTDIIFK